MIERKRLLLQHFRFLRLREAAHFRFVFLRQLLNIVLQRVAVVFGQFLVLFGLLGGFVAVAADVADGDFRFLAQILDPAVSLRRTSVESDGTLIRITRPSFCGLNPRSLARIAFSMSLIVDGSNGRMTICVASGAPTCAIDFSGVDAP